ncbi:phage tail tape measure protein [Streptomyces werraensis]|uniref:phage tail tape measure protein n=1 Tax=Streptomyces werraensis TaxID=68284 RepID=UPI003802D2DF
MALTVGELNAILSIDDRAVDPALRRAENALRDSGRRMGSDAEDEGEQAGTRLGEGLVRGADGQWRNMRGELVDEVTAAAAEAEAEAHNAGRRIGQRIEDGADAGADAAGDAIADGVGEGADQAVSQAGTKMERLKQVAKGAGLAAGAAAGAALMAAMSEAMDHSRIAGRLGAQLGATPAEAQKYGKIAGQLYADAVTEDFQGAADAISAVMRAGIAPPGATQAQLKQIATGVSDLSSTFELDLGQTANAVGQTIKTGLAKDGREAIDIFTAGLQKAGPRADDLMDTFNEYSVQFQNMGLDAKTATGLLVQGMRAGARDTDVVADAIKEFSIEAVRGGEKIGTAWDTLGLDSGKLFKQVAAGGDQAKEALDQTIQALATMEPGVKRDALAVDLFGTKAEDLGEALFALDPSSAEKALGRVGGAADRMGDTLRDNAGTRVEQFKRGMQQGLVNFLGGPVLGSLEGFKKRLGGLWNDVTKGMDGASMSEKIVAFIPALGAKLVEKAGELAPKIAESLSRAGQRAAEWIMANPGQAFKILLIAAAFVAAIVTLPYLVAGAIAGVVGLIVGGLVTKLVLTLRERLPEWWAAFVGWVGEKAGQAGAVMTRLGVAIGRWFSGLWSRYISGPVSRAWTSFISSTAALPGRASAALSSLGSAITQRAARAWQSFRDASVQRALAMVAWVAGLPGRISRGIGSLSSLLTEKGRNVVQGLWNGISSMGGWIRSKLISWAKDMIPGPIAKALGIASPSKVTAAQGKWIAQGLVAGLTGNQKQVKAAAYKLSDIVRDALTGKKERKAIAKINKSANSLVFLAGWDAKVAAQLKTAKKRLDTLTKARTQLVNQVRQGVLNEADITKQDAGGWNQTAGSILAGLKQDTLAAQTFAKNLATLQKKGVRRDLIAQIAQAGVSGGAASAAALANASSKEIKAINDQQALLNGAAAKAGRTAGDAMYGAGIRAAQGLVRGLTSHQKYIESTMLRIAKSMSKSIRKALGIKSPSRVMAQVGEYTALGLVRGMEGQRSAVNRTMQSLVDTPAPGSWDMRSAQARRDAARRTVIEIRSSGRAGDDFVTESLRRSVRKKGGGDVDLVIAGRRSR